MISEKNVERIDALLVESWNLIFKDCPHYDYSSNKRCDCSVCDVRRNIMELRARVIMLKRKEGNEALRKYMEDYPLTDSDVLAFWRRRYGR